MSTQIAKITGGRDKDSQLLVTQFFGGVDRGECLQLTTTNGKGYVQLTIRAARMLQDVIDTWRKGDELPPLRADVHVQMLLAKAKLAMSENGSNDDEHEVLRELCEEIDPAFNTDDIDPNQGLGCRCCHANLAKTGHHPDCENAPANYGNT